MSCTDTLSAETVTFSTSACEMIAQPSVIRFAVGIWKAKDLHLAPAIYQGSLGPGTFEKFIVSLDV